MSAAPLDPESPQRDPEPDPRPLPLSEIARELAELLEMGRRDDESWSLDFWRIGSPPQPFVSFTVRTGLGGSDWSIQRRIDPHLVQRARMPFLQLRREVELAYQKVRDQARG